MRARALTTKRPTHRFVLRRSKHIRNKFRYSYNYGKATPRIDGVLTARDTVDTRKVINRRANRTVLPTNPFIRSVHRNKDTPVPLDLPMKLFHPTPFFPVELGPEAFTKPPEVAQDVSVMHFVWKTMLRIEQQKVKAALAVLRNEPLPEMEFSKADAKDLAFRVFKWYMTFCGPLELEMMRRVRDYRIRMPFCSKGPSKSSRRPIRQKLRTTFHAPAKLIQHKEVLYAISDIILRKQWAEIYSQQPGYHKRMYKDRVFDPREYIYAFHRLVANALVEPYTPDYGPRVFTPEELAAEDAEMMNDETFFIYRVHYTYGYELESPVFRAASKLVPRTPSKKAIFSLWFYSVFSPDSYPIPEDPEYVDEFYFEDNVPFDKINAEEYYSDCFEEYRTWADIPFSQTPLLGAFRDACLEQFREQSAPVYPPISQLHPLPIAVVFAERQTFEPIEEETPLFAFSLEMLAVFEKYEEKRTTKANKTRWKRLRRFYLRRRKRRKYLKRYFHGNRLDVSFHRKERAIRKEKRRQKLLSQGIHPILLPPIEE